MPKNYNGFNDLDFIFVERENKYYAYCMYFNHELSYISTTNYVFCRLKAYNQRK